ncbi:hypothetical protein [Actinomadura madurae]
MPLPRPVVEVLDAYLVEGRVLRDRGRTARRDPSTMVRDIG